MGREGEHDCGSVQALPHMPSKVNLGDPLTRHGIFHPCVSFFFPRTTDCLIVGLGRVVSGWPCLDHSTAPYRAHILPIACFMADLGKLLSQRLSCLSPAWFL